LDGSPIHAGDGGHGDGEDAYGGREGAAVPAEGYLDLDRGASSAAGGEEPAELGNDGGGGGGGGLLLCLGLVRGEPNMQGGPGGTSGIPSEIWGACLFRNGVVHPSCSSIPK